MTTVLRPAAASRAEGAGAGTSDGLVVRARDDGRGAAEGPPQEGFGITGMRSRVAGLGGTLEAGRSAEGGFTVRAVLPLPVAPSGREPA